MKKKTPASPFDKFSRKRSNAAIKESFKQEKRKHKKEREAFFDQKRAEKVAQGRADLEAKATAIKAPVNNASMPLNKFIAHCGVTARREACRPCKKGAGKSKQ